MQREDDFFHSNVGSAHWFGVCEARNDPAMMGRVRVRIFGFHSPDRTEIPTETLPWATIMLPTTAAGVSGVMSTAPSIVEGTWVVGFFRDGISCQDPVVIGTLIGMSSPKWTGLSTSQDPKEVQQPPPKPTPVAKPSVEAKAITDKVDQQKSQEFFDKVKDSISEILLGKKIDDLKAADPDFKETPDPIMKDAIEKTQSLDEASLDKLKAIDEKTQADITSLSPESIETLKGFTPEQRTVLKEFLSSQNTV
jgi:hypothetical protein